MAGHIFQDSKTPASVEKITNTSKRLSPLLALLDLVKPYRARFWLATVALLVSSGLGLVYPQAARKAVDQALADHSMTQLNRIAAVLILLAFIQGIFIWVRHYLMSWLGERVVADLRVRVFDRLLGLPPSWFHARHTGEIMSRLSSDVTVIDGLVGTELSMALRHGLTLIGGIVMLLVENAKLTLIMLSIVPPLVLVLVWFGRRVRVLSRALQDRHAVTATRVEEVVSSMQTVQSFVREAREASTYRGNVDAGFEQSVHLIRWRASLFSIVTLAVSIAMAVILWVGGREVVAGKISGGNLLSFLLYTVMVAAAVGALASLGGALQRAAGATERIFEILHTTSDICDPPDPQPLPAGGGAVRFDHVEFSYANRADQSVLHGISLDVAPGQSVALVGQSGAGKTTLTALLQRFHDVTGGSISFEGVDIRKLALSDLRRHIVIVSQEPVLFSGSIMDNIAFARPDASPAEVESAARDAHAHEFIQGFSNGYQTQVGERGVQLSGGQRQRIAIARAILADPRVLILDEATSNLDAESEALVQKALQRLMVGRTTLIVAHRLSTVRDADKIVVLEQGRIVESGRHDDLIALHGTYQRLIEHQVVRGVISA